MKNDKLLNYKQALKVMHKKGISEKEFLRIMERGELTIMAKHPVTQLIRPFKIFKIHPDGKIDGEFLEFKH